MDRRTQQRSWPDALRVAAVACLLTAACCGVVIEVLGPHYEVTARPVDTREFVGTHAPFAARGGTSLMAVRRARLTPLEAVLAWVDPQRDVLTASPPQPHVASDAMDRSIANAIAAAESHLGSATALPDLSIERPAIEGGSGGLMFALTLVDLARHGEVTAGRTIAGTGTIAPDGTVGPVGDVAIKAQGAERTGAEVFFVPRSQLSEAAASTSRTRVVPVGTLEDAVAALEART